MLYIVTFTKKMINSFHFSIVQNSHKAVSPILHFKRYLLVGQPKRVKFTNCSQFLSHNVFGLDFYFYVILSFIGIGQVDNDV